MRRAPFVAAAIVFALSWSGAVSRGEALPGQARMSFSWIAEARADGEIHVGDRLMAIGDVSLDEARICRGSKVSVSGRMVAAGKVFLDVALADGHVVKAVPMAEIRRNFRLVGA